MRPVLLMLLSAGMLSGCAAGVKELRHHPAQERLELALAAVMPHTSHPDVHYWIRVSEPSGKAPVGLAILPQRHLYLSAPLMERADEAVVTALIVHGVAHHRLHHAGQRTAVSWVQRAAFKAGGFFVPGLSHGHHLGGPLVETALSTGQEPQADAKTIAYLARMGRSPDDLVRALEFLVAHGYSEKVGRIAMQGEDFATRIAALRRHPPADSDAASE